MEDEDLLLLASSCLSRRPLLGVHPSIHHKLGGIENLLKLAILVPKFDLWDIANDLTF